MDERTLCLRLELAGDAVRVTLLGPHGEEAALPAALAHDLPARLDARLADAALEGSAPGAGLYGDLFAPPLDGMLDAALAWVTAAPERRLGLVLESASPRVAAWPLELLTHGTHGLLGARSFSEVRRAHPDRVSPKDAPARRRHAAWRRTVGERLRTWADAALARGHWEERVAFLRSALALAGPRGVQRDELRFELALALPWTEGEAAALALADRVVAEARGRRGALVAAKAARLAAELLARRGAVDEAAARLARCIALATEAEDVAAEADARVRLARLLFEAERDAEAVREVPRARRACRRAARPELEGQLDLAASAGAERHGHPRTARRLLERAARLLATAGLLREAATAGARLGYLLQHRGADTAAAAAFVVALRTALDAPAPLDGTSEASADLAGLVVEGLLAPLFREVGPRLLARRRPDELAAVGLLLLLLSGAAARTGVPLAAPPPSLLLVLAWSGRLLRAFGWIAAEGSLEEDGTERLVADRLSRRARRLALELDRLSGGGLEVARLHDMSVVAARANRRSRRGSTR